MICSTSMSGVGIKPIHVPNHPNELGLSRQELYPLTDSGEIAFARIGKAMRFKPTDIELRFRGDKEDAAGPRAPSEPSTQATRQNNNNPLLASNSAI